MKFTWTMGSTVLTATAFTDATGKARASQKILSTTSRSMLYVKASTSAYSINRSSTRSFERVD